MTETTLLEALDEAIVERLYPLEDIGLIVTNSKTERGSITIANYTAIAAVFFDSYSVSSDGTISPPNQVREFNWSVNTQLSDLSYHRPIYLYLNEIRKLLHGWTVPGNLGRFSPIKEQSCSYASFENGTIWQYSQQFKFTEVNRGRN